MSVKFLPQKMKDLLIIWCSSREFESLRCKKRSLYLNIYYNMLLLYHSTSPLSRHVNWSTFVIVTLAFVYLLPKSSPPSLSANPAERVLCFDHTSSSGLPETSWCGEPSDNHLVQDRYWAVPAGARLKGRLHAEFRLFETSALSSLSLGFRQTIDCRERVRDGGGFEIFLGGRLKPGLWLAISSVNWQHRDVCLLLRQEKGLASLGERALLCCTLRTGPAIEYVRKLEF